MLPQTNMFRENRPFERKLVFQPLLFNGFREGSWKILRLMFSVIFDGHPEFLRVKNHHEIELINTTTPKINIAPEKSWLEVGKVLSFWDGPFSEATSATC